ncbi:hypothetical protein ACLOJK_003599 [Asimina triloba]
MLWNHNKFFQLVKELHQEVRDFWNYLRGHQFQKQSNSTPCEKDSSTDSTHSCPTINDFLTTTMLDSCKQVTISGGNTVIFNEAGDMKVLKERSDQIRSAIEANPFDKGRAVDLLDGAQTVSVSTFSKETSTFALEVKEQGWMTTAYSMTTPKTVDSLFENDWRSERVAEVNAGVAKVAEIENPPLGKGFCDGITFMNNEGFIKITWDPGRDKVVLEGGVMIG